MVLMKEVGNCKTKNENFKSHWECLNDVLELSQDPRYQDVTIICDGGLCKVNSFLLASIFPVIKILSDPSIEEMCISLPGVKSSDLKTFLLSLFSNNGEIKVCKQLFELLSMTALKHEEVSEDDLDVDYSNDDENKSHNYNFVADLSKASDKSESPELQSSNPVKKDDVLGTLYSDEEKKNCELSDEEERLKRKKKPLHKNKLSRIKTKFDCSLCDYSSFNVSNVKRHHQNVHVKTSENNYFLCPNCKERIHQDDLDQHDCATNPKFQCKTCGKGFPENCRLQRHLKTHRQPSVCKMCDQKFNSDKHLKRHMALMHTIKFPYGKAVIEEDGLDTSSPTKKTKYQCSLCDLKTDRKENLKRHYETKHVKTVENGYFQCPECKLKMPQDEANVHSCIFYPCEVCGKQFTSILNVKAHMKLVHEEIGINSCEICGKTFERSGLLKNHIANMHKESNKVPCHICGSKFSQHKLKIHMLIHEDKKVCTICDKEVRYLERHIKAVHTSDDKKSQHCPDCGKGFSSLYEVKKHQMNVHLKLRPYKCRYGCTFAYNDMGNRNAHEKKTHGKLFDGSVNQMSTM